VKIALATASLQIKNPENYSVLKKPFTREDLSDLIEHSFSAKAPNRTAPN
jgi:hypothetical protein